MKKLYDAADRFCARHPRFGIPDLMRWIVIGNVVVYVLMLLTMRTDAINICLRRSENFSAKRLW